MTNNIIIFDTTLRDGEQSPGASLDINEKVNIARQLALLNVDVIEAGFPVSSPGDFESVSRIAGKFAGFPWQVLPVQLRRISTAQLRRLKRQKNPEFTSFGHLGDSSEIQAPQGKGGDSQFSRKGVKHALKYVNDVEFSPEDASRTELDFLIQVVEAVIDAGAKTVNIPDTVGYAVPDHYASIIRGLKENVKNIGKAVISVHCHNDLGDLLWRIHLQP